MGDMKAGRDLRDHKSGENRNCWGNARPLNEVAITTDFQPSLPARQTEPHGSGCSDDGQNLRLLWTTPVTGNACGDNKARAGGASLTSDVTTWSTPTTGDTGEKQTPNSKMGLIRQVRVKGDKKRLNVLFVEWLQGLPIGWSDCEPSETPYSPRAGNTR